MIIGNTIAPRIEARILDRLQDAVKQIAPDDIRSLLADGLFQSHCSLRAQEILSRHGFIILGEIDDGIARRYIDGLLTGPMAEPFSRYFLSQQVHFHLKATVHPREIPDERDFSPTDILHVPLLHVLGPAELTELEAVIEAVPIL